MEHGGSPKRRLGGGYGWRRTYDDFEKHAGEVLDGYDDEAMQRARVAEHLALMKDPVTQELGRIAAGVEEPE